MSTSYVMVPSNYQAISSCNYNQKHVSTMAMYKLGEGKFIWWVKLRLEALNVENTEPTLHEPHAQSHKKPISNFTVSNIMY